ncbi:ubiquitin-like domain-containing protein [Chloroflexota bacterium]
MNKIGIIAIVLVIIIAIGTFVALELHQTITIMVDEEKQIVTTWAWTVGDALTAAGIPVVDGDIIAPLVEARLPKDNQINIKRASWVTITADGDSQSLWTTERLPQNLLEMAAVEIGPQDILLWNGLPITADNPFPKAPSNNLQIHRASLVSLAEGSKKQQIISTEATLGGALWEKGIILKNNDHIVPHFETALNDDAVFAELQRARSITIQHDNGTTQASVLASNVGEALSLAGLPLQGQDYSIPPESASLPITNTIRIVRVHEEVSLETEPLPFGFLTQPLEDVELDTQQVVQVGEYGLTAKRQRVVYEDGIEVSRQTEDEWVAREPKPRILGYGTKINIHSLQTSDGPIEYWRAVDVYGSTYSPCRSGADKCYPNTSSGKPVQKGVIAVTLDWYRFMQGLPAYVPNYGFGTIEDVGGGLPDRYWIDLGYSDDDWVGWGGWMTIYFLTPVPPNIMWILE